MDRAEIVAALTALARRLDEEGIHGEMYVVGGAAIALAYAPRRVTRDIDAVFEPKMSIYRVAAAIADELGLPPGWLNDAAKAFLAGPDPLATPVLDMPGLRCLVASPGMVLALKVLAHRVGEDDDDVKLLSQVLGLGTAAEVLDVAEAVFGDRLDVAARFFVEEIFAS
jgi:hypothetical protein